VLEEESRDNGGQSQPSTIHCGSQDRARESQGGSIRLQRSFDIPLPVELRQPRIDLVGMSLLVGEPPFHLPAQASIDFV